MSTCFGPPAKKSVRTFSWWLGVGGNREYRSTLLANHSITCINFSKMKSEMNLQSLDLDVSFSWLLHEVLLIFFASLCTSFLICFFAFLNFLLSFVMRRCSSLGEDVDDQLPMISTMVRWERMWKKEREKSEGWAYDMFGVDLKEHMLHTWIYAWSCPHEDISVVSIMARQKSQIRGREMQRLVTAAGRSWFRLQGWPDASYLACLSSL